MYFNFLVFRMKALIIGTGIGGLSTALRLLRRGYEVEMVEQFSKPGGRLNQVKKDGYLFDMGPSFFSMSYEFEELARDAKIDLPFRYHELDPIYTVRYDSPGKTFKIYKDLEKLAYEFREYEPDFEKKMQKYLSSAGKLYHDTEGLIINRNFDSLASYAGSLLRVPPGHLPKLGRNFWQEVSRYFQSDEVREIVSLVSFFLGGTPFNTPAVYSLLSYTEFVHDGYYNVEGGMYKITEGFVNLLQKKGVKISYNTSISGFLSEGKTISGFIDKEGQEHKADFYVVNADAAVFRSKVLERKKYTRAKLDKKNWTMAPLTIYLGLDRKVPHIDHHNYFLRNNFKEYSSKLYRNQVSLDQPYYYVNVLSRYNSNAAPEGGEALYILVPVPDRRLRPDWSDSQQLADSIIGDLSSRIGFNIKDHIVSRTVLSPVEWEGMFDLHRGSGLGLGHNLGQMAWFRPPNKDEQFSNLFYSGSSTVPGTGIPMAVISSRLVTERIEKAYGSI
jgi:phytoene desaturase